MLAATGDDRRLADQYRAALAAAHGSEFEAARLHAPGNVAAGVVYAYRGNPSWVFVYLDGAHRSGGYRVELATTDGRRVPLTTLRIDPRDVASVRLVGAEPCDVLEADLPQSEGWED